MDTLANVFSTIQTAYARKKPYTRLVFSKHTWAVCRTLFLEGYIDGCARTETHIFVHLKYTSNKPPLHSIQRISSPGKRKYIQATDLRKYHAGLGTALLSTSKGILCDRDAQSFYVGGEVLAHIF
jgi:small subunit ribosomal protein S8